MLGVKALWHFVCRSCFSCIRRTRSFSACSWLTLREERGATFWLNWTPERRERWSLDGTCHVSKLLLQEKSESKSESMTWKRGEGMWLFGSFLTATVHTLFFMLISLFLLRLSRKRPLFNGYEKEPPLYAKKCLASLKTLLDRYETDRAAARLK